MKLDKIKFARLIAYLSPMLKYQFSDENISQIDALINVDAPKPKFNEQDSLFQLLMEGKADLAAQRDAAKWIKELHGC